MKIAKGESFVGDSMETPILQYSQIVRMSIGSEHSEKYTLLMEVRKSSYPFVDPTNGHIHIFISNELQTGRTDCGAPVLLVVVRIVVYLTEG